MGKKDDAESETTGADAAAKRRAGRDAGSRGAPARSSRGSSDIAFVEALAQILRENDLAEIEVTREFGEDDEMTVRLVRYGPAPAPAAPASYLPAPAAALSPPPAPAASAEPVRPADPADHPGCVTSPMVGTVYLAPEPGAASFVQVGDMVEAGQTLLIVEAMKTMNQIPSPKSGKVKEILVSNGEPIEYGAPLMVLE